MSVCAIQVQITPGAALTAVGNQTSHHPHHFHVSHLGNPDMWSFLQPLIAVGSGTVLSPLHSMAVSGHTPSSSKHVM